MAVVVLPTRLFLIAAVFALAKAFVSSVVKDYTTNLPRGNGHMIDMQIQSQSVGAVGVPTPSGRHRKWVQSPSWPTPEGQGPGSTTSSADGEFTSITTNGTLVRILSYNVLGPRHALTSRHDYCPRKLRSWKKRSERLQQEMEEYHDSGEGGLHAVCLQEVTPKALQETWIPFMEKLGLNSHLYRPKHDLPMRNYSHRCLGVAIFYSTQAFEKVGEKQVYFAEELELLRGSPHPHGSTNNSIDTQHGSSDREPGSVDGRPMSLLECGLRSKLDAAVILRLKVLGSSSTEDDSGATEDPETIRDGFSGQGDTNPVAEEGRFITLVCCHLWFDPVRPDLKTAQCKLLFAAIERFHRECGVKGQYIGREGQKLAEREASSGLGDIESQGRAATNLVLCGDFNSMPFVQPYFLPQPLQAKANEALAADKISPTAGGAQLSCQYPSHEASASGVYSLLAYGRVGPEHPEHPDAFIPPYLEKKAAAEAYAKERGEPVKVTRRQQRFRERYPAGDGPPVHRESGEWTSGYGRMLEDVYRDRCNASPLFTTKTSTFAGIIDHIFVSSREPGSRLSVKGVLGFPTGADVASGIIQNTKSLGDHPLGQDNGSYGHQGHADESTIRSDCDGEDRHNARFTSPHRELPENSRGTASPTLVSEDESVTGTDSDSHVGGEDSDTDGNASPATGGVNPVARLRGYEDGEFGPIPDMNWGSDHLALGVELVIR